jgi:protein tyrosine phosphatase (PTP) superfamily phosphohydrolase (DUF442 family)
MRSRSLLISALVCAPIFAGSVPGIKNFDQVDDHVYRGAQPTDEGFRYLAKLGVKTVIDLQAPDSRGRAEQKVVTGAGMQYINVPMSGLTPPTEAEITKLLGLMEDSKQGPVFVHCHRGADRTGAVIAAYHIDHDKWENSKALKDAEAHSMSFFQLPRKNFIRNFQPRVIEAAKIAPSADRADNSAVAPVAAASGAVAQ